MKTRSLFLIVCGWITLAWGQFSSVKVTLDDQLLRSSDKQLVRSLIPSLQQFYTQTEFDQEYSDLGIALQVQLIFEGTSSKGSAQTYLAQALFSNGTDQRYFDKAVQFVYAPNQTLYYDPVQFESLPSFLAFYGELILAGEIDTYEPMGGTHHYEEARNIALRGQSSDYSRGWSDRVQLVDDLTANSYLRRARFHFYYGDELLQDQKPERALEEFQSMLKELEQVFTRWPRERNTLYFLKANAPQLTLDLGLLNRQEDLEWLAEVDPDNGQVYRGEPRPSAR
ncbi:MAG: DUF4835 family protein [Candidatus Neomarinimicrobiota bacterium]|nr:MAG: DUF4835 family protein [Candidatus Neomarinimicrobiota bacterium]